MPVRDSEWITVPECGALELALPGCDQAALDAMRERYTPGHCAAPGQPVAASEIGLEIGQNRRAVAPCPLCVEVREADGRWVWAPRFQPRAATDMWTDSRKYLPLWPPIDASMVGVAPHVEHWRPPVRHDIPTAVRLSFDPHDTIDGHVSVRLGVLYC